MIQKLGAANSINLAQDVTFASKKSKAEKAEERAEKAEQKADKAEFKAKAKETSYDGPKIGFFRLAFQRLTKEQIDAVNESGKLPGNGKFYPYQYANGFYKIGNKILNINPGTATLPAGYEARRNWLGFTLVVPKDTESVFIKKKPAMAV